MADLHAWRNAATELPPDYTPVVGMLENGSVGWYERIRDDDGGAAWAESELVYWDRAEREWSAQGAYYDDDYRVRYWHPLPDVPTLAELDAAHGAGPAADAASGGGE